MEHFCCDPFNKTAHKVHPKKEKMRDVTAAFAASAHTIRIHLVAGMKICATCRIQIGNAVKQKQEELKQQQEASVADAAMEEEQEELNPVYPSPLQADFIDKREFIRVLNSVLPQIEVEKIDFEKIGRSHSYCRNVLEDISEKIASKIFEIPRLFLAAEQNVEQEIVEQLKAKFKETQNQNSFGPSTIMVIAKN